MSDGPRDTGRCWSELRASSPVSSRPRAALYGQEQATVYLSVMDQKGAPVLGVDPSDIVISEEAGRSTIQSVTRFSWPLKVTVLVDNGPRTGDSLVHYRTGLQKFFAGLPADVAGVAHRDGTQPAMAGPRDDGQGTDREGHRPASRPTKGWPASATRSSNTPTVSATSSEACPESRCSRTCPSSSPSRRPTRTEASSGVNPLRR